MVADRHSTDLNTKTSELEESIELQEQIVSANVLDNGITTLVPDTSIPKDEFEVEGPLIPEKKKGSKVFTTGVQLYCLSMICGSLMRACSKLLVERYNMFVVLFLRMSITCFITLGVMHYMKVEYYFWGHPAIRTMLFIRGILGVFNIVCTFFALKVLSLPDVAVISFLIPLTTSLAARCFLGEQYNWKQMLASLVSLSGVVVIARPAWLFEPTAIKVPDISDPELRAHWIAMRTIAIICCLLVVITGSAVTIILRKIKDRAHALTSVASYTVLAFLFSSIMILVNRIGLDAFPTSGGTWCLVLLVGLFGFMLQFLSSKAIQMEEATKLANFKYTQLLYATVLEFIFWHDIPDIISVGGMALILSGVICSAKMKSKEGSRK